MHYIKLLEYNSLYINYIFLHSEWLVTFNIWFKLKRKTMFCQNEIVDFNQGDISSPTPLFANSKFAYWRISTRILLTGKPLYQV